MSINSKLTGIDFNVKFKISFLVASIILYIIVAFLYYTYPNYREIIKFTLTFFGGIAVIYTAYVAAMTLQHNAQREKISKTFEYFDNFNALDRAKIRVFTEKEIDNFKESPEKLYERIIQDEELNAQVKSVLGFLEDISLAVQIGYIDEKIVYRNIPFIIVFMYEKFKPFIDMEREKYHDNLFCELEKIYNSWKNGKYISTGENIPIEDRQI